MLCSRLLWEFTGRDLTTKNSFSLFLENESGFEVTRTIFERILKIVSEYEKLPNGVSVNLLLSDDETICRLNKKFRGVDKITDVLSFPAEIPGFSFLGDIIINVEAAEKQKETADLNTELQKLFLHGLLHLLGYDHLSANQKKIMEEKERELFIIVGKRLD